MASSNESINGNGLYYRLLEDFKKGLFRMVCELPDRFTWAKPAEEVEFEVESESK